MSRKPPPPRARPGTKLRPKASTRVAVKAAALTGRAIWAGPAGIAGAVVLVVQLIWRTAYLVQGYFVQDDFLMLHLGGTSALTPGYLAQDYSGHLFPGGFLIAFVEARVAPLSWPAAYVPVVLMQLGAGVLMWMVLSRVLGGRWERVPLLVVFCLSPLSLWSTQWWAVAIQFLPLELCALAAALSYLRWRQDHQIWGWRLTLVFAAGALLFQERGVLVPFLVLAVALVVEPTKGVPARIGVVLRSERRLWLGLVAIVVAYLVVHAWLAPVQPTAAGMHSSVWDLVWNFILRNVATGLVGGPWSGSVIPGAVIIPTLWVTLVSCGIVAGFVAVTARFGGTTARVCWLVVLVDALADVALLFGGRSQYGGLSALPARYAADMLPILVVGLAAAIREVSLPRRFASLLSDERGVRRATACVVVAALYVASAGVTSHRRAPDFFSPDSRSYVETLRADLDAQPAAVIFDSTVPSDVMFAWFGSDDRVSTVISIADPDARFDVPSEQMRMVDDSGHLRSIDLTDPVKAVKGPNPKCGYNVTLTPVVVAMSSPLPVQKYVLQLGYYTNIDDDMVITAGPDTVTVPVTAGLHSVDVVLSTAFSSFTAQLSRSTGTLCLAGAVAGVPTPSSS